MERRFCSVQNAANNLILGQYGDTCWHLFAAHCSIPEGCYLRHSDIRFHAAGSLFFFFSEEQLNSSWPTMAAILTSCHVFDRLLESAVIKHLQTDRILREGPGNEPVNYLSLWRNTDQVFPWCWCVGRNVFYNWYDICYKLYFFLSTHAGGRARTNKCS